MSTQSSTPGRSDLSKMIRIDDKAMKVTYFFSSPEQHQRFLDKQAGGPVSLKKGGRASKKEVEFEG